MQKNTQVEIDAQGKKIGRVASEVAKILMGKSSPDYARNKFPKIKVKVLNASKVVVTNKKLTNTKYKSYSGYPGGLKEVSMKKVLADKGYKEVFRKAVYGMLPINKLRPEIIKNLVVQE